MSFVLVGRAAAVRLARRMSPAMAACCLLVLTGCGADGTTAVPDTSERATTAAAEPSATVSEDSAGGESVEDPGAEPADEGTADDSPGDERLAPGVYREYSSDALAEPGYETNVIFFHASWCPECRAFEQAIEAATIPAGVQILKLDYDTNEDLKNRYGVDLQSTFVKVDDAGEKLSLWVGYGKDRSVDTILAELE